MKMTIRVNRSLKTRLLSMATLLTLAVAFASCAGEEIAQGTDGKTTGAETEADKNLTTFVAGNPETRTSFDFNTGAFYWEEGDRIYVKDDDGTWQVSSNAVTSAGAGSASFKFMVPGNFTASNTYKVYYPGKNGTQDQVTIPANQNQTTPNDTKHIGVSGDCGIADATKDASGRFNFRLDHKPAILVFQPYCSSNAVLNSNDVKLTKIEITSDNNLVGTFTLDPTTSQLTGSGSGRQIDLTTGGSATPNGFSVPTAVTPEANASYVVIKPGTHTLKVRFWLKDNVTNVEGILTKSYPSFTYAANTYYSMPSELKIRNYTTPYYMWDAQQPYWYGHEWDKAGYVAGTDQPTVNDKPGSAYPQSNTDPRWCNESYPGDGIQNDAITPLFTTLPNANEISWYVMQGDPRWDGDELWSTMGHLYKGGIWLKKKAYISGFRSDKAADNSTDLRTTYGYFFNTPTNISSNPISTADQSKYFYLPALGVYSEALLYNIGSSGYYWGSHAYPEGGGGLMVGYNLYFHSTVIAVGRFGRRFGFPPVPFE